MDTLKTARFRKNMTQAELAKLIKTHHSQISLYESGEQVPFPSKRRKIEQALGGAAIDWSRPKSSVRAGRAIREEKRRSRRRGSIIQELEELIPRLQIWLDKEEGNA